MKEAGLSADIEKMAVHLRKMQLLRQGRWRSLLPKENIESGGACG